MIYFDQSSKPKTARNFTSRTPCQQDSQNLIIHEDWCSRLCHFIVSEYRIRRICIQETYSTVKKPMQTASMYSKAMPLRRSASASEHCCMNAIQYNKIHGYVYIYIQYIHGLYIPTYDICMHICQYVCIIYWYLMVFIRWYTVYLCIWTAYIRI